MQPDLGELLRGAHRKVASLRGVMREWVDYEAVYEASREPPDNPRGTSVLERKVWVVPPARAREEAEGHAAGMIDGRWWQLHPDGTLERGERAGGIELRVAAHAFSMLDPRDTMPLLKLSLLDTGSVAGRPSLLLRAERRDGVEAFDDRLMWMGFYADHWLLEVDAERGVVLSVQARDGGTPLSSVAFTSIAYDEPLGEELFVAPAV